jgi:drug/metabolite transporter (DMT)-like permease
LTPAKDRNKILGRPALFLATIIWGVSFVVLKDLIQVIPTMYVLAFRFTGGALILLLIGFKELKKLDLKYVKGGVVMGMFLFLAYVTQTYGLYYTTPGKNAFLTTTYCIIVPFLHWAIDRRKPSGYNIFAALVCLAGVGFISWDGGFSLNVGDLLTICCGLFFALHIIATNRAVPDRSVLLLTVIQFLTAGALAWISAALTAPLPREYTTQTILQMAYIMVMCTAVCYMLQTYGQKHTPPSSTALIMTMESVFGAVISIILGYETLKFTVGIGFVLMFSAVIISETRLSFLRPRKKQIRDNR